MRTVLPFIRTGLAGVPPATPASLLGSAPATSSSGAAVELDCFFLNVGLLHIPRKSVDRKYLLLRDSLCHVPPDPPSDLMLECFTSFIPPTIVVDTGWGSVDG